MYTFTTYYYDINTMYRVRLISLLQVLFKLFSNCLSILIFTTYISTFSASVVDSDSGLTTNEDLPMSVLLNEAPPSEQDIERVSTGTKYALSEWLRLKH